jgi:hypothetical protein
VLEQGMGMLLLDLEVDGMQGLVRWIALAPPSDVVTRWYMMSHNQ